jgi:hypothetical protein
MTGNRRGHVMLELALSAGVMAAALAGTFQFGYTFYVYNQLVTAVGHGGRYAAQRTYRAATEGDVEKGRAAIRNLVIYGDARPGADAAPVVPGLKPEHVRVEWIPAEDSPEPAAVAISITGYEVDALFGRTKLQDKPAAQFPFVGRFAPGESEP